MNLTREKALNRLYNINYKFNDFYGITYISYESYIKVNEAISYLRLIKEIDGYTYGLLNRIYTMLYHKEQKIKDLESVEPRKVAQRFIGRKKIRNFIFNRDNYRCLKCGTHEKLSIDHINPVNNGGENKLSNLQTLCRSCNSKKSDNFKDYR